MFGRLPHTVLPPSLLFLLAAYGQVKPLSANLAGTAPTNSDIVAWGVS